MFSCSNRSFFIISLCEVLVCFFCIVSCNMTIAACLVIFAQYAILRILIVPFLSKGFHSLHVPLFFSFAFVIDFRERECISCKKIPEILNNNPLQTIYRNAPSFRYIRPQTIVVNAGHLISPPVSVLVPPHKY